MTTSEAHSLSKYAASFEFLLSLVVWYKILFFIDEMSKKLQSKSMCIGTTNQEVKSLMLCFENFRNEVFEPKRKSSW